LQRLIEIAEKEGKNKPRVTFNNYQNKTPQELLETLVHYEYQGNTRKEDILRAIQRYRYVSGNGIRDIYARLLFA
jgi:hypothetical protein